LNIYEIISCFDLEPPLPELVTTPAEEDAILCGAAAAN